MLPFSNPRLKAEFDNWPSGSHRVKCVFEIETHAKRGQRVVRTTADKNGRMCAPKKATYAVKACIVTGSDERTYILELDIYGGISVNSSDFMSANLPGKNTSAVYKDSSPELFEEFKKLIDASV